ncbi:hypothetical protein GUJ93_ZPchr0007g3401 [Zizania palustris]|uniref:Uncharacterized protein n=1 Tax=Zizania palustris TaxID=103762 RepID=A0A8J5W4K8_ZIZPA|nr:hypothetical protein GUJ93_ZPchr0007g3401 [Zizania palustris]
MVAKVVPAVTPEVTDALVKNIRRRMTSQPLKICADIEMKCFQFDGVLHIKQAMRKAESAGNDNCPVKIKLVAPPLYVLTTQTLDKDRLHGLFSQKVVVMNDRSGGSCAASSSSDALAALEGTEVAVTVGVPNELLRPLAASRKAVAAWVHDNVTRYSSGSSSKNPHLLFFLLG